MKRRTFIVGGIAGASIVAVSARTKIGSSGARSERAQQVTVRRSVVSGFGTDTAAVQRAIDSGATEVVIDIDVTVTTDIMLRSGQTLRFAGGRLIVAGNAKIAKGILYAMRGSDIGLVDPHIDATATPAGVPGIRLIDVDNTRIQGGHLKRANIMLESYDNKVDRGSRVVGTRIDMDGYRATALYLSGLRGVSVEKLVCSGGIEGVGIYNQARAIRLTDVTSSAHQQDGFLIYAGQDISHHNCRAYGNGQSGFTTQRDASGADSRFASWSDCQAWDNVADGFDMRGAKETPWNVDTGFTLSRCTARTNGNCGFYVVMAEGTQLDNCTAHRNQQQNLFISISDRVAVTRFRSTSGSIAVAAGPNKAGILVYDSDDVQVRSVTSDNIEGASQDFGVSFTGRNKRARLSGGRFSGNRLGPFYADKDVSVEGTSNP